MKCFFNYAGFITCLLTIIIGVNSQCKFPDSNTPPEDLKAYQKLKPLIGRTYSPPDPSGKYQYQVGICKGVTDDADEGVGVTQTEIVTEEDGNPKRTTHVVGKYTESSIMAGTNWILLQYEKGDPYNSHCKGENRRATILFTCDPSATDNDPGMKLLEEEKGKDSNCYYLFELAHPEICDKSSSAGSSLSIGSIILIVFFCLGAVYLIAGGLYMRFVLGAKGKEQIPNYDFWKDFGNLQADGCNFLCRAHDARQSSPYKGLGDDQLEEPEGRDDNLLPM
ncbi:cation-dependent mannose-6-phosphate receptor-like isoform X2 [Littorina saxatilis]|uniref:MRH domain-containing protein n=1 Tax=Littorina saxatilis TaxID=31220 RepID=A0AAN9AV41_9CAEN